MRRALVLLLAVSCDHRDFDEAAAQYCAQGTTCDAGAAGGVAGGVAGGGAAGGSAGGAAGGSAGGVAGGSAGGVAGGSAGGAAGGTPDAGPLRYAFVTSKMSNPSAIGGLSGADALCNDAARDAGLAGNFVAWLSSTTVNAGSRLQPTGPWFRRDGLPFAESRDALLRGAVLYPLWIDEFGRDVRSRTDGGVYVVTGTQEDGGLSTPNCANYTVGGSATRVIVGDLRTGTKHWTQSSIGVFDVDCITPRSIYCFGADPAPAQTVAFYDGGNLAFLSHELVPGYAGATAFDGVCRDDARDAGLTGTFVAFVSSTAAAAIERVDGGPWIRPDGVVFSASRANLARMAIEAPLDVTLQGEYLSAVDAFTGSTSPLSAGTVTSTCNDWTSDAGTPTVGYAPMGDPRWFVADASTPACHNAQHVYCLQP